MTAAMDPQLLVTKIRPPLLPLDWVARPRLSGRLAEALRHRVALLSAPAGYGKTTLVAESLRHLARPTGWLSLDVTDNAPGTFLSYLVAALEGAVPGLCRPILDALRSPQPPPTGQLLTALVNAIGSHPDEVVLVLDDYHAIEAQAVHEAVAFIVQHLPAHAHLAITSRVDPPLPLARWRVKGHLAEVRAGDLALTGGEAAAYLREATGIDLPEQELATLERRTEGWIAGLKMAALSMRGKRDVSGFISSFSGSHRYVLDYFVEEVLSQQRPDVRQFLLETSVLERLSGSLCDALTGRDGSQSILERLEKANLFISPLDDERRWYRYHQLFATILRNQLAAAGPEAASMLHRRASQWYEGEGLVEEAIRHSLLGGDGDRAADLLELVSPGILSRGQALGLLEYRARVPASSLDSRPLLCVSFAWAALLSHQWDLLSAMLARAGAAVAGSPGSMSATSRANLHDVRGHLLAIQGYIAQAQGDIPGSIHLSEEANRQISAGNLLTRSANSVNLGINYLMIGNIPRAVQHLDDANSLATESGNSAVALSARAYLAQTEMLRLRLDRGAEICRETIELGSRWGGGPLPYTAIAFILLGQILYERNHLEDAEGNLAQGIRLAEANSNWTFLLKGCLALAKLCQAKGDSAVALRYLRRAEGAAPRAPQAREGPQLPAWGALMALRRGDIAAASDWARREVADLPLSRLPDYSREFAYLTLVRLKLAQGDCRDLPSHLEAFIHNAEGQGRDAAALEGLILKAVRAYTSPFPLILRRPLPQ
jgi:LuxR family transcriptional regulator, maltose regulon positive regulatory protein